MWINCEVVTSTSAEEPAHIAPSPCEMKMIGLRFTFISGLHKVYVNNTKQRLENRGSMDHSSVKPDNFYGLNCLRTVRVTLKPIRYISDRGISGAPSNAESPQRLLLTAIHNKL